MKREVYAKAKEQLHKLRNRWRENDDSGDLNIFCLIRDNGKVSYNTNTACYASLNDARDRSSEEAFVSLTTPYGKHEPSVKTSGAYCKWLLKESPMSSVFKSKDWKQAATLGIICHTNKVRADLFGAAIISHRVVFEYPKAVERWNELVEGGVLPSVAYMMMGLFSKGNDGRYSLHQQAGGHYPLPYEVRSGTVLNFVRGTPSQKMGSFKQEGRYKSNSHMWDGDGFILFNRLKVTVQINYPLKKTLFGGVVRGFLKEDMIAMALNIQKEIGL